MAEKSPMLDDFPSELNHGVAATGGFPHWPYSGADNQAQEPLSKWGSRVDSETKSKQMLGRKANGLIWHSMNHSDTEDVAGYCLNVHPRDKTVSTNMKPGTRKALIPKIKLFRWKHLGHTNMIMYDLDSGCPSNEW